MSDETPPRRSRRDTDHRAGSHTGDDPEDALLRVRDLEKHFGTDPPWLDRLLGMAENPVRAVDGVSFDIHEGETLGLVGESGCGKSTVGETILQLQEPTGGSVEFGGTDVTATGDLESFRRRAQIVFQDPFSSLDPRMPIGRSIRQPLVVHDWPEKPGEVSKATRRRERVAELMERVGLSAAQLDRYPGEFSGGQRQRVGIARALALDPDFVVLDEPTSALDVSVQAQILNLLADLQAEFDLTYLFISHDLGVIRYICDRIAVMYLGEIVEIAPADELFANPQHPYTKALLESVPRVSVEEAKRELDPLSGDVPSPRNPPSGCRFRTRCPAVIPPGDLDVTQSQFRAIMDVRDRIESRSITLEQIRRSVDREDEATTGTSVPSTDTGETEILDALESRLLDVEVPHRDRTYLREAFEYLLDDEWEAAASHLGDRYETICETDHPGGGDVACHLVSGDERDTAASRSRD